MTSDPPHRHITARDHEILAALLRCPLTVEQLLTLSRIFALPFSTTRRARRRLQVLLESGHAQRFRYATSSQGSSPYYYKPTLHGLRIVRGKDAQPPTKGYLSEISVGHHNHTHHLANFIVHTFVAAKHRGLTLTDFCGENTVRLDIDGATLFPDCCFRLVDRRGQPFNFLVELDNSTETVRSPKALESWQRKVRLYERFQDTRNSRFRVLVLTTKSRERRDHILDVALEGTNNRERIIFYGAYLPDYLAEPDGTAASCFLDHNRIPVPLVPGLAPPVVPIAHPRPDRTSLPSAAALTFAPIPEFV